MSLRADSKYIGTVGQGSEIIESRSGSLGYQVMIESDEGNTSYTIWLSAKNRDRAKRDFEILGVSEAQLTDERFVQHQLGIDITGRRIKFGMVEEEYKGKVSIKVGWIGRPGADGNAPRAMAGFFKGTKQTDITDDDIPF